MAEYIKRENAIQAAYLIAIASIDRKITCGDAYKIMNDIPNADVVERKKGKWLQLGKCSECGGSAPFWSMASTYYESDFCPHCGADMREES